MGTISLPQPVVGQPNSTEDPKIASGFGTLQTWANGNVDDSNLANPNNAVRRLLLTANGRLVDGRPAGDYLLVSGGAIASGAATTVDPPMWMGDAGFSSQPPDFQVAGKSAYCRVRIAVVSNATLPGVTVTGKLYGISTSSGSGVIAYTWSPIAGSSTTAITFTLSPQFSGAESPQFAMPLVGNVHALGVAISGTVGAGSIIAVTAQLYGYNA